MVEIRMPEAGFNITEGKIVQWYKKIGDKVGEGESIVSVETDKITVDIPAEVAGVLHETRCKEGEVVPVGGVVGIITEEGESPPVPKKGIRDQVKVLQKEGQERVQPVKIKLKKEEPDERKISPAAKAVAKQKGIDLSQITSGTGPAGRIVKEDVLRFIETQKAKEISSVEVKKSGAKVEFKGWRKVIADRVTKSCRDVPQCTVTIEADVTELSEAVTTIREKEKLHITYLPFLMKALVNGIEVIPELNACCNNEGYTIQDEINIGIVVNAEGKLLVPVVRAVREKQTLELAREIELLVEKARNNKLEKQEIEGGTITITNVGPFQIHTSTALIFQPQTAIVQMGLAREIPAVWKGNIEVRKRMNIGVTYDHRVLNGAMCGKFLMEVRSCLEDLNLLLIR